MKRDMKKSDSKKMVVDQITLLKFLRLDAERRAAGTAHILAMQNRAVLLAKIDPEGQLTKAEQEAREAAAKFELVEARIREIMSDIEKRYKISVKDYTIDDETGELTKVEEKKQQLN